MPNIKTYDTPNIGLNPSETGVESFAAAGRRGGVFFNQGAQSIDEAGRRIGAAQHLLGEGLHAVGAGLREAGDVAVAYADHQRISARAKSGADMLFGLTEDWNSTASNSDPNDPSTAQKWIEEKLEPTLRQWQDADGFDTERSRQWAEHYTQQTRQHFFEKTSADMSSRAKVAAIENATDVSTRYSNIAVRNPDFHTVQFLFDMVDDWVDDMVDTLPHLKGSDAANIQMKLAGDMKRKIANEAAGSAIQKSNDPEATAAYWANGLPDQINGKEALVLGKAAKVQAHANELQQRALENEQQTRVNREVKHKENDIWATNTDPETGKPNSQYFKDALKLPSQYPNSTDAVEAAKSLIKWGEDRLAERDQPSNQAVLDDFQNRMFDPNRPTSLNEILRAENDKSINTEDAKQQRKIVNLRMKDEEPTSNPQFKYAMATAKELIDDKIDPMQRGKFGAFQQQFLAEYQREYRAGTLKPNALNTNDQNSLISQTMDQYLGVLSRKIRAMGGVGAPLTFNARFAGEGAPNVIRTIPVTATPGISATPPVSLPPMADRVKGQVYQTGRGRMEWTGHGWIPPSTGRPPAPSPGEM